MTPLTKEAVLKGFLRVARGQVPKAFKDSVKAPSASKAWRGYREQAARGGDESLIAWPIRSAAKAIVGKDRAHKVDRFVWNNVSGPALAADVAAGRILEKTPLVGKKLFRVKEKIPWGKDLHREVSRPSALGPLTKARDIAEPIIVGVGLEKGIRHLTKKKDRSKDQESGSEMKDLRKTAASVMLHLHEKNKGHEKRAHATRLLYRQIELGLVCPPQSYSDFETKLASLVTEDLAVLEKALELAGGNEKLGELGHTVDSSAPRDASEKFQASILSLDSDF